MLLRQNATVANIYLYLTMTGILLYLGEHDRWIVATKSAPETESPTAETKE
jgi:hypothetical protein